jgi:hypothetical protein
MSSQRKEKKIWKEKRKEKERRVVGSAGHDVRERE